MCKLGKSAVRATDLQVQVQLPVILEGLQTALCFFGLFVALKV